MTAFYVVAFAATALGGWLMHRRAQDINRRASLPRRARRHP